MYEPDMIKVIEVAEPERMLDSRTKTAMLTVATWADFYRLGEDWRDLQLWRLWAHGKHVNEVSHLGEYTTVQGDILTVCPVDRDNVVCQVQITEIRMVDCDRLTDQEIHELGYLNREEYDSQWDDMNTDDSSRGWFMRFVLLPGPSEILH